MNSLVTAICNLPLPPKQEVEDFYGDFSAPAFRDGFREARQECYAIALKLEKYIKILEENCGLTPDLLAEVKKECGI